MKTDNDKKQKSNTIKKQFKSNTELEKIFVIHISKDKIQNNKLLQICKRQFNYKF